MSDEYDDRPYNKCILCGVEYPDNDYRTYDDLICDNCFEKYPKLKEIIDNYNELQEKWNKEHPSQTVTKMEVGGIYMIDLLGEHRYYLSEYKGCIKGVSLTYIHFFYCKDTNEDIQIVNADENIYLINGVAFTQFSKHKNTPKL